MVSLLWMVAIPVAWVLGGYFSVAVTERLSFFATDGWCEVGKSSLGVHCFGDFTLPNILVSLDPPASPWSNSLLNSPGPGASFWPHVVAVQVQSVLGLSGLQLSVVWICAMACALMTPAVWLVLRHGASPWWLFGLGLGAWPSLVALDRGNSVALLVPIVLAYLIWVREARWGLVSAACAAAFCIKPQMAILALALLAYRRWGALASTVASCAALLILGFVGYPGGVAANIRQFLDNFSDYGSYQSIQAAWPLNLSAARSIMAATEVAGHAGAVGPSTVQAFAGWLGSHSTELGLVLLAGATAILGWRGRRAPIAAVVIVAISMPVLVPGVSYAYYSVLLLPLAGFLLAFPPAGSISWRELGWLSRLGILMLTSTLAVALVPLLIPVGDASVPLLQSLVGPLWLAVTIGALIVVVRVQADDGTNANPANEGHQGPSTSPFTPGVLD